MYRRCTDIIALATTAIATGRTVFACVAEDTIIKTAVLGSRCSSAIETAIAIAMIAVTEAIAVTGVANTTTAR